MPNRNKLKTAKPAALPPGGAVRIISPASPFKREVLARGVAELERRGYCVRRPSRAMEADGYFAGTVAARIAELQQGIAERDSDALICARGGYGSTLLLDALRLPATVRPKLLIGFSDVTALQVYFWMRYRWTSLYGPMGAAGWDKGSGRAGGYDWQSFSDAAGGTRRSWSVALRSETLIGGTASGVLLGGCLALLETTLGTPWELDTRGAILLLEDCNVKPYQLDRMLVHLRQAGKFRGVRGIVLGEFPDADSPKGRASAFREVCMRVLGPLKLPMVFGAAVGHTARPILTLPLGVRVKLVARGAGKIEVLEPAVVAARGGDKKPPARRPIKIVREIVRGIVRPYANQA
jgi:muramoyltetrapeptide carboxypeptidase